MAAAACLPLAMAAGPGDADEDRIDVDAVFSPGGECSQRIVEEIRGARERIRVQVYIFTSKNISNALVAAKKRGVKVEVILDKSQEKQTYGVWRVLRRDGVGVFFDGEHATANNKVILIDDHTVITGSFNFTKAAEEKNAENMMIVRGHREVFEKYLENFEKHKEHAKRPGE
jgi:phosphatidylserine/phosphatidylglycerophosphate/cardiolipin synthase-like enzyme